MNRVLKTLLFALLALSHSAIFAQASNATCQTAEMIGASNPSYPLPVNQPPAPGGNDYGCLATQPNPLWFYFEIAQAGNVHFLLSNTNNVDVDFILYGPFPSSAAAFAACGQLGTSGANGGVVDCSYSGAANEDVDIINAQPGSVYMLLVTNFSNQGTTGNTTIALGSNPAVLVVPNGINPAVTNTCANGNFGAITTNMQGGTAPYQYIWSNGATTSDITGLAAGNYSVTVTDATGATFSRAAMNVGTISGIQVHSSVNICVGDSLFLAGAWQYSSGIFIDTISNPNSCDTIVTTNLSVNYLQGFVHYGLCAGDSVFVGGAWRDSSGYFYDTIANLNGCDSIVETLVYFNLCTPVWAGDTDDDLTVDGNDWLQLGLSNGLAGYARNNASINWVAQPAVDWGYSVNNIEAKHSDTDGNGLVEDADTLAIVQNYGQNHPRNGASFNVNNSATIRLVPQNPQYQAGDLVVLDLMLADANAPLGDAYGYFLALDMNGLARTGTMQFTPSNAFLGATSELWSLSKEQSAQDALHIAQVRSDLIGRTGYGKIGEVSFVLANNTAGTQTIGILDYRIINSLGADLPATASAASIRVLGVEQPAAANNNLIISPNPIVNQSFAILKLQEASSQAEFKIYNNLGQLQHSQILNQLNEGDNRIALPTQLPAGVYTIECKYGQQSSRAQFIQIR